MIHVLFDTETTGLIKNSRAPLSKQPHIFEFFGLKVDDDGNEVAPPLHLIINPGVHIPEPGDMENGKPLSAKNAPAAITGFTDDMVADAPFFHEVWSDIDDFFAGIDVAVAHNFSYDYDVINFEFQRIDKEMVWPERRICTVEATEHFKGYRLKLGLLYEHLFGERFDGAHKAENDVRALARIYQELRARGEV